MLETGTWELVTYWAPAPLFKVLSKSCVVSSPFCVLISKPTDQFDKCTLTRRFMERNNLCSLPGSPDDTWLFTVGSQGEPERWGAGARSLGQLSGFVGGQLLCRHTRLGLQEKMDPQPVSLMTRGRDRREGWRPRNGR